MLISAALTGCLVLAAILVTYGLKTSRFSRMRRKVGGGIAVLLAVGCIAVAVLMVRGLTVFYDRHAPVPDLRVESTPQRIARGQEVVDTFCGACHARDGVLVGGRDIGKDLPLPLGSMVAPNLTPAGPIADWSDGQLYRAIRNAVDADGRWLMIMSLTNASRLADEDVKSVIAYLRSIPPVGVPTQMPPDQLNPLGMAMLGAGMLPRGHPVTEETIIAPTRGVNVAWGQYLLSYQDCNACHGADLHGGVPGQLPPIGPDLAMVMAWSLQDFITTMRTGIDPGGHQIQEPMPWRILAKMSDGDLEALFQALTHLPPAQVSPVQSPPPAQSPLGQSHPTQTAP
jgi:mono/diheme cytochrome c family protein